MRFAVDAHAIGRQLTGNEVYIRSVLGALAACGTDELIAYVSTPEAAEALPQPIRTRQVAANPFWRLGWELASHVWRDQADLLHVQYTAPLGCPVPVVVTVHDVSFLEHPEYFTHVLAMQLKWSVRRTVQRAARIVTVSEFSRRAILKAYGDLEEDRVIAVPNAAAPSYRPLNREVAMARVRERLGISTPFLLTVGDLRPNKNHIGLIRVFARLARGYPHLPHQLVLAGKETWFAEQVYRAARESGVAERIRFLGFVTDQELVDLYNACEVFVFPSFYEGFGLPVLEAMACGRAVACSSTAALPEVVDSAAILFDPYRPDEVVRAISDLLLDTELRTRMQRLGLQRAAHFSWQASARKMLDVFYEVAAAAKPARQAAIAAR